MVLSLYEFETCMWTSGESMDLQTNKGYNVTDNGHGSSIFLLGSEFSGSHQIDVNSAGLGRHWRLAT
jgi:hypothetical protein